MTKKAIYTAIIDNYDTIEIPRYINPDYSYILFTNKDIKSDFWEVRKVEGSGVKLARHIKIRHDIYLPEYEFSVWMDANIIQNHDINTFDIGTNDMMTMKHPSRDCIYDEVQACINFNKDDDWKMAKQTFRYRNQGYPEHNGLIASGVLFRWHNLPVKRLMKSWDYEVAAHSHRDQLSFNFCLSKQPLKLGLLPYYILNTHFLMKRHK